MPNENEALEYRDIPGFPGYEARSDGTIWSRWELIDTLGLKGRGRHRTAVIGSVRRLKSANGANQGRMRTVIRIGPGKEKPMYVHRLVLMAFVGPCPPGCEACHNDGNPKNNKPSNLRWDTHQSNLRDKLKHGTEIMGIKAPAAKLKDPDIREIFKLRASGMSGARIGRIFGVSENNILHILHRKSWSHIDIPKELLDAAAAVKVAKRSS